jgi:hypothetical protein
VRITTVNGIHFTQQWSLSVCRQTTPGGACTVAEPAPGTTDLVRIVVTVQWRDAGQTRTERAATLVGAAVADPIFPS